MNDITPKILEELRENKGWSKTEVARRLGIKTVSTYANWEYGIRTPDKDMLSRIADLYSVSTDYLINGKEKFNQDSIPSSFSEKEEKDIAKKLESILNDLDSDSGLAFDGEPLDETTRELVKAQIESNLRLAKQLAKKKFTPKKYRDDSE